MTKELRYEQADLPRRRECCFFQIPEVVKVTQFPILHLAILLHNLLQSKLDSGKGMIFTNEGDSTSSMLNQFVFLFRL